MALEDTIAANTAAVLALTAALNGNKAVASVVTNVATDSLPGAIAAAAGAVAGIAVTAAGQPALAPEASAIAVATVTDVLNAAGKLIAAKGKPKLLKTLSGFNAKSIQAIAPENLKAALDAINTALAAP